MSNNSSGVERSSNRFVSTIGVLFFAAIFIDASQSAEQTVDPSQHLRRYHITVWVLRPVIKRNPTDEQFDSDRQRWQVIKGIGEGLRVTSDADLLRHLRQANPDFDFTRIEARRSAEVTSDVSWIVPGLPATCSLTLVVHHENREETIKRMAVGKSQETATRLRLYVRNRLIVEERYALRITDDKKADGSLNARIRFTNYHALSPDAVVMVDAAVQYANMPPPKSAGAGRHRLSRPRHVPTELVLFAVKRLN
jgi:hypothetical protein